ncbi:MAG: hypothetical protein ACRDZO_10160 [Egibacteraceae bacterium]
MPVLGPGAVSSREPARLVEQRGGLGGIGHLVGDRLGQRVGQQASPRVRVPLEEVGGEEQCGGHAPPGKALDRRHAATFPR